MKKCFVPTLVLATVFLLFLSGCQKPKDLVFKEFKNLKVDQLSFSGAALNVDLVYYNPNNFGLQLSRTDLDIFVDSIFLGHSTQNIQVSVPRRDNFTIPLKVDLDVKNLLKNGISSLYKKDVKVRVLGSVKLGKAGVYKTFAVDYTTVQNFSLFK
jgi:LEA14-like dessication related protein